MRRSNASRLASVISYWHATYLTRSSWSSITLIMSVETSMAASRTYGNTSPGPYPGSCSIQLQIRAFTSARHRPRLVGGCMACVATTLHVQPYALFCEEDLCVQLAQGPAFLKGVYSLWRVRFSEASPPLTRCSRGEA